MPLINQNTELRSNYHITNMRFLSGVEFIRGEKKKKALLFLCCLFSSFLNQHFNVRATQHFVPSYFLKGEIYYLIKRCSTYSKCLF